MKNTSVAETDPSRILARPLKVQRPVIGQLVRRSIFYLAVASVAAIVSPTFAAGISGTYVGSSPDGAFLVEVVETNDGQLTGRYEQVLLQSSGKLADTNAALSGAANNGTVVITIKPTEFLSGSITISGTFDGRALHLAGGGNGTTLSLNLVSADESVFRTQVANLTNVANQIHQAGLDADALAKARNFIKLMDAFSAHADAQLKQFAPTEQNLQNITDQMRLALAREQATLGDGQASVARSQISVWISQAEVSASQIHNGIDAAYRDFDGKSAPILTKLTTAIPGCYAIVSGTMVISDSTPANVGMLKSTCVKVLDSAKSFQAKVASVRQSFARIAGVWNEEHQKQAAMVRASEIAAQ